MRSVGLAKVGLGVQPTRFVFAELGVWHWYADPQDRPGDDDGSNASEGRRALFFNGVSASWRLGLQLPFNTAANKKSGRPLNDGPYLSYGRHCWSAYLEGLLSPWQKQGCSSLSSLGFVFPAAAELRQRIYVEWTQTQFDEISSGSVMMGARYAL